MANLIAIPANHADQMFLNHKFFKQYDRLMEYIHTVLIIKQPEIYIDTIFYDDGAQIELTWKHVDVIYWVDAATQHCRIAFTELDTNLGKNQKYRKY